MKKKQHPVKIIISASIFTFLAVWIVITQLSAPAQGGDLGIVETDAVVGINIGDTAPNFRLATTDRKTVELHDFIGQKAVIVNFWASWCPPCREEFPEFEKRYSEFENQVEIIAVNLQESPEAIDRFANEIPVSFPLVQDPTSVVKQRYNVFTQPVTYFIDSQGVIVDKKFGPLTPAEYEGKLQALVS